MSAPFRVQPLETAVEPTAEPVASALRDARGEPAPMVSAFVPLLLLGLVLLAYFTFQATQLRAERATLAEMSAAQEKSFQDSKQVRGAVDAVARGTAQLADAGNTNARLIVEELKRRGVTITPNQSTRAPVVPPAP